MFNKERLQRFSIRKLTIGAASVLIGVSFMTEMNTNKVYADTTTPAVSVESNNSSQNQNGGVTQPYKLTGSKDDAENINQTATENSIVVENKDASQKVSAQVTDQESNVVSDNKQIEVSQKELAKSTSQKLDLNRNDQVVEVNNKNTEKKADIIAAQLNERSVQANQGTKEGIKVTDPSNYPKQLGELIGNDKYIYQVLSLEDGQYYYYYYYYSNPKLVLSINRDDHNDKKIYAYVVSNGGVKPAIVVDENDRATFSDKYRSYQIANTGNSSIFIDGKEVPTQNTSTVTSETGYYNNTPIKQEYGMGNTAGGYGTAIGEIIPVYTESSVIKYYYRDDKGELKEFTDSDKYPNVIISGLTGQEFVIPDVDKYKRIIPGYYLTSNNLPTGDFKGTLSQFSEGKYYKKVYYDYDTGKVENYVVYHQVSPNGTMEVGVFDNRRRKIAGFRPVEPKGSTKFELRDFYKTNNLTVRNPYVTETPHEAQFIYQKLGSIIPVDDESGKTIGNYSVVFNNSNTDPTKAGITDAPIIPGYTIKYSNQKKIRPDDPGKDITVVYKKIGNIVPVDKNGDPIPDPTNPGQNVPNKPYVNDPNDPTKVNPNEPVPNVPGYTPSVLTVTPTDPTKDTLVIYIQNDQVARVNYVDADENNKIITTSGDLSGKAGEKIDYSTATTIQDLENKGYVLVNDGFPKDATYDNDDNTTQTYTVVLRHDIQPVNPNTPDIPKKPDGKPAIEKDTLKKTVNLTVTYKNSDGTAFTGPKNANQSLEFDGTVYIDKTNGQQVNAKQENGKWVINSDNKDTSKVHWNYDTRSFAKVISPNEDHYYVKNITSEDGKDYRKGDDVDVISVNRNDITSSDNTKSITVTVTYAPKVKIHVKYVDDDKTVPQDLSKYNKNFDEAKPGTSLNNYSTADSIAALKDKGYVLVSDAFTDAKLNNQMPDADQTYEVHLVHGATPKTETKQVHLNVTYQAEDGTDFNVDAPKEARQSVEFTGTYYVDKVTSKEDKVNAKRLNDGTWVVDSDNSATPKTKWNDETKSFVKVTSPKKDRYYVTSINSDDGKNHRTGDDVDVINVSKHDSDDINVVVHYAIKHNINVHYIDDNPTDQQDLNGYDWKLEAKPGDALNYTTAATLKTLEAKGYKLEEDDGKGDQFTAANLGDKMPNADSVYNVYLVHDTVPVNPGNPGKPNHPLNPNDPDQKSPNYPEGSDQVTKTVTRTIHYTGAGKDTPADFKQTVKFTAEGLLDKVTGKWINPLSWSDAQTLDGVNSKNITDYHIVSVDKDTTDNKNVTSVNVNHNTNDYIVTVTYAKDQGSVQVIFHDDTDNTSIPNVGYNSNKEDAGTKVDYATKQNITDLEDRGYVYVSTDKTIPTVIEGNKDIVVTVHVKHGTRSVDPQNPVDPKHPENPVNKKNVPHLTQADLQKQATRTVNYVDDHGNKIADSVASTVIFTGKGTIDTVTGNLVNLNSDGSIKDQKGQLTWTYAVDNGKAYGGTSYTFNGTANKPTIEFNGGTYRFSSVDQKGYDNGNGSVKAYSVDNINPQDLTVYVRYDLVTYHTVKDDAEDKTVTRTINYLDAQGHNKVVAPQVTQKSTLSRTKILDDQNNFIGYGMVSADGKSYTIDNNWKLDKNWAEVNSPDLSSKGYKDPFIASVAEKAADENTQDTTVNVYYDHNEIPVGPNTPDKHGVDSSQFKKNVKETVHYIVSDGKVAAPVDKIQTSKWGRTVTVDAVTNEVIPNGQYDKDWTIEPGQKTSYDQVNTKVLNGYYTDQANVPATAVTQKNIEKTVTYNPIGHIIPVDKNGDPIPGQDHPQFKNDPNDPTKVTPGEKPTVSDYHPETGKSGDPVDSISGNPGEDVKVRYIKDQGSVKVVYYDDTTNAEILKTEYNTGLVDVGTKVDYTTNSAIKSLEKQGYVYVSTDGTIPTTIEGNKNITITVHMKHGFEEVNKNNPHDQLVNTTVTRTINYTINGQASRQLPSKIESINFVATGYWDKVLKQLADVVNGNIVVENGQVKQGGLTWTSKSGDLNGYPAPELTGYYVAAASATSNGKDVTTENISSNGAIKNISVNYDDKDINVIIDLVKINPIIIVRYIDDDKNTPQNLKRYNWMFELNPGEDLNDYAIRDSIRIKDLQSQGFVLVNNTFADAKLNNQIPNEDKIYEVHFVHEATRKDKTRSVKLNVTYKAEDGNDFNDDAPKEAHQTVDFIGTYYVDKVTGKETKVNAKKLDNGKWVVDSENTAKPKTKWDKGKKAFARVVSPQKHNYYVKNILSDDNKEHRVGDDVDVIGGLTHDGLTSISILVQYALKRNIAVHYIDDNPTDQQDLSSYNWNLKAKPEGTLNYSTANTIKLLESKGYKLEDGKNRGDQFTAANLNGKMPEEDGIYNVYLIHTTTTVTSDKPGVPGRPVDPKNPKGPKYPNGTDKNSVKRIGTQTIHYIGARNQTPKDDEQSFEFIRTIIFDNVTGKLIKTTPWNVASYKFDSVDTPAIDGYHADKLVAGGKTITPDNLYRVDTVTYTPDAPNPQPEEPKKKDPQPDPKPTPTPKPDNGKDNPGNGKDKPNNPDAPLPKTDGPKRKHKSGKDTPAIKRHDNKNVGQVSDRTEKTPSRRSTKNNEQSTDLFKSANKASVRRMTIQGKNKELPKTGEDTNAMALIGLMFASLAGISILAVDRKHE